MKYKKIATLKTADEFRAHIKELGIELPFDETMESGEQSPLGQPYKYKNRVIGNRWSILPMEGWDCLPNGAPGELTRRRWLRFGESGAKLLFGCEAAAVCEHGKSNTRQMMISKDSVKGIADLRQEMVDGHEKKFGRSDDLYVGLQLTHSGRFSHPVDDKRLDSVIAYHNPVLDEKFGNQDCDVASDELIEEIIAHFIDAAELSYEAGFDFVDIKHAHGYFGHELLSAFSRKGKFGGSFENRTRFFREIVEGIQKRVPELDIAVRLSLFDMIPFKKGDGDIGVPWNDKKDYPYAFGGDGSGLGIDLTETIMFIDLMKSYGIEMLCTTVGSPYYIPHIQRPAYYPVSDGYLPPEDPLVGVARQINAVAEVKRQRPDMLYIGSGYTYLQEWLPNVGQYAVRNNMADFVGIGRMVLSYPAICEDSLAGKPLDRCHICRTFGDCTNAPRNGLVSGCYPLDHFYKEKEEFQALKEIKKKK